MRRPDLFPVLRVLADRKPLPARFLVLGSASPALLRQSSESLAGRLEIIEIAGFSLAEVGAAALDRHWLRIAHKISPDESHRNAIAGKSRKWPMRSRR